MEVRSLGASGRSLSVLGFGAWVTGADTATVTLDEGRITRAINAAVDAGIDWIDTAEIYAAGRSEELVGRVVRPIRDRVSIVTKVAPAGAGSGLRPEQVGRAIRASLRRLGTDRVDLYLVHWYDPSVPVEETWGAMRRLVEEGLARSVGVSNFDRPLVERCLAVGPVDVVENQLSMLHRDDLHGLLSWLSERGIGYLGYGALAFGLLSGRVTAATTFEPSDWRGGAAARYESNYYEELFAPGRLRRHLAFVEALSEAAGEAGVPLPALALRWVLEHPGVTGAVIGSLHPDHVRADARAGDRPLDHGTRARVDELVARWDEAEARWRSRSGSTRG